jgi:uncharacterized protein with GYD domain
MNSEKRMAIAKESEQSCWSKMKTITVFGEFDAVAISY